MADNIDFLSGSCKQDVTDLICLSAHLNLNRRLEEGGRQREGGEEWGNEGETFALWLAYLQLEWVASVRVSFIFIGYLPQNHLTMNTQYKCVAPNYFSTLFCPHSLIELKVVLVRHLAGCSKALIPVLRGARRDLLGVMIEEQPTQKSFTRRHTHLLDISYWLDAAADQTDLFYTRIKTD